MDIQGYVNEVRALYASGQTTEHSFRPALAKLFQSIDPALTVINEPKHITDVGAPDFVFNRGEVAIGWCEAKDIGKDVRKFAAGDYSKEQKARYTKGLPNLIYTNGLDFEFIRDGDTQDFITIADLMPTMPARPDSFAALENRLRDFASVTPLSITGSKRLAELMAGKAAIIKDIMGRALMVDMKVQADGGAPTDLIGQYEAFRKDLIHDITVAEFADIYAETIAYGLFAARLHDETPNTFSRAEALDLLPKTNPFLRELFIYIAGPTLDERLRRVIDQLCNVFLATNMAKVLANFGKFTGRADPFLHFYETFLAEYNPAKRKARGVWYTPEPVVNFIVRAVDEVLKTEFGLADGLADTSRITIDWDTGQNDPKTGKPATIRKEVHRVQILDPATGTGTFLAEVVKLVAGRIKGFAPGQLSAYIEADLIPRLHGFELLMASYAMCHMKLDMILTELGYKPSPQPPRLGVYLTNSLEEGERVEQTLFGLSRAIANEAKAANDIKRQTPIMCVIGNPPYSVSSHNKSPWIQKLIDDYKRGLGEKKINLDDDYIKFIRFAQAQIQKIGHGVIGVITNNSFLDGVTHRKMRENLLNYFDSIYILDLHGSSKKKEISPDGFPDKNVFDIMQGVSITIMIKNMDSKPGLARLFHADMLGSRESKYDRLWGMSPDDSTFAELNPTEPYYFFVSKNFDGQSEYDDFFSLQELFPESGSGVKTERDKVCIHFMPDGIKNAVKEFHEGSVDVIKANYNLDKDSRDWTVAGAIRDIRKNFNDKFYKRIFYRPFDVRFTYYTGTTRGFMGTPGRKIGTQFFDRNMGLVLSRTVYGAADWHDVQVTDTIVEFGIMATRVGNTAPVFPLYLYPEEGTLDPTIRVNFDPKLYAKIRAGAGLTGAQTPPDGTDAFRKATGNARPDEVKVFDYIYGVLHSPAYRATYAEFLKIDFPRVPFPASPESFAAISAAGETLRRLHLMEPAAIGEAVFPFEGDGDSTVDKPRYEAGKVWINPTQAFAGVSETAWAFHIGGYQPAQKWLKDRKGRALTYDDIRHYQRIIKILNETARIMGEIELPPPG